jgi:Fe-S-cluster containining protein
MSNSRNGNSASRKKTLRILYNCSTCPAYCCSYDRIEVSKRDLLRIARHFGISYKQAEKRYTKIAWGDRVLRHKKDHIFKHVCEFLDQDERRCTIYDARPSVCRGYSERQRQGDDEFIPSA